MASPRRAWGDLRPGPPGARNRCRLTQRGCKSAHKGFGSCAFEVVARRCLFLALCSDSRRLHQLLGADASGRVFSSVGSRPKNWGSESNEGVPHELELLALASMRPPGRGLRPDPAPRNGDGRFAGRDLDASRTRAEDPFHQFARDLDGARAARRRRSATIRAAPARRRAGQLPRLPRGRTRVELHPTGRPSTPYVGVLRYTEIMYACPQRELDATARCRPRVPVTEVFRSATAAGSTDREPGRAARARRRAREGSRALVRPRAPSAKARFSGNPGAQR